MDADDKVAIYRNWLGLMRGDLTARFARAAARSSAGSTTIASTARRAAAKLRLPGRSLMLVRNVGHLDDHRRRAATRRRAEVPEGILDAVVTRR